MPNTNWDVGIEWEGRGEGFKINKMRCSSCFWGTYYLIQQTSCIQTIKLYCGKLWNSLTQKVTFEVGLKKNCQEKNEEMSRQRIKCSKLRRLGMFGNR